MLDLTRHPRLLRLLSFGDRLGAFLFRSRRNRKDESNLHLAQFYRRVWFETAAQMGASVEDLGHDVLEIRLGDRSTRVYTHQTAVDDLPTPSIVRLKGLIYKLLAAEGLPVPDHVEFTLADMKPAVTFLDSKAGPCVIKPACGASGGLGVATGIRTRWQLARAAWTASLHGDHPSSRNRSRG